MPDWVVLGLPSVRVDSLIFWVLPLTLVTASFEVVVAPGCPSVTSWVLSTTSAVPWAFGEPLLSLKLSAALTAASELS